MVNILSNNIVHKLKELQNEKNYFCSQRKCINVKLRSFCEKKLHWQKEQKMQ